MTIPQEIWREYDIRGIANKDIEESTAEIIGKAFGTYIRRNDLRTVVAGHDTRKTSPTFHAALVEGIQSTGCHVIDIGMVPTPVMYFGVIHYKHDAGIIVTASHNPPQYNGFKGRTFDRALYGPYIQELRVMAEKKDFEVGKGSREPFNIIDTYVDHIKSTSSIGKKLKVVIDAGNGVAGPTVERLFKELGFEVVPLFCNPDGDFPNHIPDPTVPKYMETLRETVLSSHADLGIGLDGDGDRVAGMTPTGELLFGDRLLSLFVKSIIAQEPGPVVFDVKCSMSLIEEVEKVGGQPIIWRTGYPMIQSKMKEVDCKLAGEMSGHMYFADRYYGYDDGLYAGLRLAEYLSNESDSLDKLVQTLSSYPSTPELRLHCSEEHKFSVVDKLRPMIEDKYDILTIDGLRYSSPKGWGLVRVSNTEPVIVTRFEAKTEEELKRLITEAKSLLGGFPIDTEPLAQCL
jgi:phosphomannomutase/phosphoglucomutase